MLAHFLIQIQIIKMIIKNNLKTNLKLNIDCKYYCMDINKKLKICVISNMILLFIIIGVIIIFSSREDKYWNWGPNKDLLVISVKIDTWIKYYWLMLFIAILKVSNVIISEVAHPILGFNIYNPDKKIITEFTKNQLQLYGNLMYFIDSVRGVFTILITISQVDVALFGVFVSEITGIYTVRMLLDEKRFIKNYEKVSVEEV